MRTYSIKIFNLFQAVFDALPLAAVIDNRVFAVHAGLSPLCDSLSEISELKRPEMLKNDSTVTDLLWSDPSMEPGFGKSARGAGFTFGADVTENFFKVNSLKLLVRGH